ncbi:HEAT repeat domain-containing protein [Streptomyces sp. WM6386]|uniref:HEAT repeat domain-containing protein n=1 Tax=Streptomyces sp. WM6386 TaxID=1415558 RepID=UPI00131E8AD0|nr:HEAT repeat domain-containing protein [Streptomyces sp. WM6386]
MADVSVQALDALPWERLVAVYPTASAKEVHRVLRHLLRSGPASTEDDCSPLFSALAMKERGVGSAATAALPFVVALAADPRTGARATLVELLGCLAWCAEQCAPHLLDPGWPRAWDRERATIQALLTDPDPVVRRQAVPLAEGSARLLERWRTEQDLSVRLPVLFALGGLPQDTGIRAVLAEALRDDDPVVRLAAVHAASEADPGVALREREQLLADLVDPAVRSRREALWYRPDVESPYTREAVAFWTAVLFEDTPAEATEFLARLAATADPAEDTDLLRTVLDHSWRLLTRRRSVAPALVPLADGFLDHPDPAVRYRAAHLLAALGSGAAAHADRLAALLDDPGEDEFLEGTVGEHARWGLARMDDARALPGLVEGLCATWRGRQGRGYVISDPRSPDLADVLGPLRAHADTLLPAVREELRRELTDSGLPGSVPADLLATLKAWGTAALPALPEVTAYLANDFRRHDAAEALAAMGPAAVSAAPAIRERMALEPPENHRWLHWVLWRIGGADPDDSLRALGETLPKPGEPPYFPFGQLADFGHRAAPYAEDVFGVEVATALWTVTGESEPARSILEEQVLTFASGGHELYGLFRTALRTLIRFRAIGPPVRDALRALRDQDRRISAYGDYRAILQDEEFRELIDEALAL